LTPCQPKISNTRFRGWGCQLDSPDIFLVATAKMLQHAGFMLQQTEESEMARKSAKPSKPKSSHGGVRPGAGRPKGTGPWGEATRPLRVPMSIYKEVVSFIEARGFKFPLYTSHVPAGQPAFADDHIDGRVDLTSLLVQHPADTFLLKVCGNSMINAGIREGDILVVDRKKEAKNGKIVVANVNGQPTVKTFRRDRSGKITLMPENPAFDPLPIAPSDDFAVLGCVTGVVRVC